MALINCRECGKVVSDTAERCPHCGAPLKEETPSPVRPKDFADIPKRSINGKGIAGMVLAIFSFAIFLIGLSGDGHGSTMSFLTLLMLFWLPGLILSIKGVRKTPRNCATIGLIVSGITLIIPIIAACLSKGDNTETSDRERLERSIKYATTVEEADSLINNTTWHYTEDTSESEIDFWVKVTFKDGRYTSYYANPSDGKWTQGGEGTYEIDEGRYSNTGEKYIAVRWKGKGGYVYTHNYDYALGLNNFQFAVSLDVSDDPFLDAYDKIRFSKKYYGQMELGDYEWD